MSQESLSTFSNYMKTKYGKVSDNVYNSATPLLMKVNRTQDFVGEDKQFPVPTGYEGGVGSGSLPQQVNLMQKEYLLQLKSLCPY